MMGAPENIEAAVATDEELIARFKTGDESAFALLVGRWDQTVLNVAYRLLGNREDARDIRQVVLLRVYQKLATFDGRAKFSTWIYRITVNRCHDVVRSQRSRPQMTQESANPGVGDAHDRLERQEIELVVGSAVTSLPVKERTAIVMRHYQDLSFHEIAEILEEPVSTIQSRVRRALQRLQAEFRQTSLWNLDEGKS